MNIIGIILIAIGFIGLLAGLTGFAIARWGGPGARQYNVIKHGRAFILASAAAPLMVLGAIVSDPRRVSDPLGIVLLTVSLLAVIAVFGLPLVNRVRGRGSTTKAIISGTMAVMTIGLLIGLIFVTGDFQSLLIAFGYVFLLLGAVVAVSGLLWLLVQLIRRKGRTAAMAFMWSAASLAIFGFIGMAVLAPLGPSVPDTLRSPEELDLFLTDLVDSGSPPGISLVVVHEGETVYNKAFGLADGPNSLAATPDTVYHWFSVTKIFTAVATMQLVEQGLINLDDPVSDYLSFFEPDYPSASSEPVTIANLLNHSSGLRDNMPEVFGWMHLEDEESVDQTELLRENLHRYDELMFEPGSKAVYTNTAYYTLGAIIEKVTGQTYEEYVIDHVLDPLGMVNTRFEYTESMRANEGVGASTPAGRPLSDYPYPGRSHRPANAAAAVYAPPRITRHHLRLQGTLHQRPARHRSRR